MLFLGILMWISAIKAQDSPILVDNIALECGGPNWTLVDTWCLRVFDHLSSWIQANRICRSYESNLVVITDRLLYIDITERVLNVPGYYWIGLILLRNLTGDMWVSETEIASHLQVDTALNNGLITKWSSGENGTVLQGYWDVGQPDHSRGSCVYLRGDSQWRWAVDNCDARRKFICQYAACHQGSFRCNNGVCINDQRRCDGIDDCGDDSDETSCPTQCRFHLIGDQGQITSPEYPQLYPNGSRCLWVVEGPPCSNVKVQFTEIVTEPDFDEVIVLVGGRTVLMSEYVGRYSGTLTNVQVISPNNLLIIKFTSDHSNTFKGFTAKWETVTHGVPVTGLHLVANTSLQEVTSPFYPSFYISQTLQWIISPTHARHVVTLQVVDLDLDEGDYIVVRHDDIDGDVMAVYNYTGGSGTVISLNNLHVMMKVKASYSRYNHRGFRFSYREGCDVILNADKGVVFSPGYGVLSYPAYQNCSWTIMATQDRHLTLQFDTDFYLEDEHDFLQVYDGLNDTGTSLHPNGSVGFSGRHAPPPLTSSSGRLYINLRSDSLYQYRGYQARFSIGCSDPGFNTNTVVAPSSSAYIFGSHLNVSCKVGYTFLEEQYLQSDYVVMKCLYGGVWNVGKVPQCQAIYCGFPPAIRKGHLLRGEGVQYGSSVTYACEEGYIASGSLTVACQIDGTWQPVPSCNAVNCSLPPDVANATSVLKEGTGWDFGSRVVYTCDTGFQLSGAAILFCFANGTWNEDAPLCERVTCPVPDIEHGQLDTPGPSMRYKDDATLICVAGFTVVHTATVTCHANQTLGILPSCKDVDECENYTACDQISQECVNTIGSYTCHCKHGYADNGTHICNDIDECANNSSMCSQECENLNGGYRCICKDGYDLYTANGTQGYYIPTEETGRKVGDLYHLNHTCVYVTCVSPPTIQDGFILNRQMSYHYGYTLSYRCNLGFVLNDNRTIQCQTDGSWSNEFPSCTVATCAPDGPDMWANATGPATVVFPGVLEYMDFVTLTCNVTGVEIFNRTRQCLYDQHTDTYRLMGDSYQCGEVNCGSPDNFPNGKVMLVTGTTFGHSFIVTCNPLYLLHGNSSHGDGLIRCASDGHWDYGNLICLPVTCPDPGRPLRGSFVGTDFSLGGLIRFHCDDPELEIVGDEKLECVLTPDNASLVWNSTVPVCNDVTRPTIAGCPAGSVGVNKYASPMFSLPVANDNLALSNFTVTPSHFNPADPVMENMTVVYTATDIAGNTAECRVAIVVSDKSLPTIQCPDSFTAYLMEMDQPYNITISSANFSVFPSSSGTLDFGPDQVHVSIETLDRDFTIYGNITDVRGNFDTCFFQIKIKATCNPATLTSPVNGQLNCTETSDKSGYRCEGRCNQGYYFYEDYTPTYDLFITECDIGGNWTYPYIPSCVSSLPTSFKQIHELVYQPVSNGSALSADCLSLYLTSIEHAYPTVSDRVTDVCGFLGEISTVTITDGQFTDIVNNTFTGTYTLEFDPPTVDASHDCVQATAWIFTKTTSVIEELKNILGITDCANLTADYQALVTNEQMCDNNVKTRDQGGRRVCLVCPPGTFKNDDNGCELCPLGTFNDREGMTSCSSCPLGTWTEKGGNSNSSDCKDVCRNGLYSNTRLPPCSKCPENSYPVSSYACMVCPTDTKYIGTTAYLTRNCLQEPCQYTKTPNIMDSVDGPNYTGTVDQCEQFCEELEGITTVRCTGFSYHSLLQKCILHHGDVVSLKDNTTYDHYSRTCNRLSDSECYCVLPCLAGNRSFDGFQPCTECPKNYFSYHNQSTDCLECPQETMTLGTGSNSNSSCVDAEQILCPRCKNGATCRIIKHDYVCDCPVGFHGRDCDQIEDLCFSKPCYNGATCKSFIGTYTCTCPPGASGDNCEVDLNDCGSLPCQNGGMCVDGLDSYTCVCLQPYYGNNCEFDNSTDICLSMPCNNGSSCISINNLRRKCVCPPGFRGQDCEINIDECASSPCLNGGLCDDGDNTYTCTCPLYQGDRCQTPRITCDSLICGNADECYNDYRTGLPQCLCNPGYTLEQGQSDCSLLDLCSPSPCQRGGTCSNVPGGHICQCPNGYGGSLCQHDLDDCVSRPCVNNGTCEDRFNNYTCHCSVGYSGDDCSLDIDECLSNPCHPAGTQFCNNTYGGFICGCNEGYSGFNCSVYTDANPCLTNPCLHGGTCGSQNIGFTCECGHGWTGQRCETLVDYCVDIDNPCLNNASCISLQNDFFCRCGIGTYGRYCDSLPDLCFRLDPCLNHANCTADEEAFTGCSCTAGFLGDGCQVMENQGCSSNPCRNGATCSLDPSGHILCNCVQGYHGNYCQYDVDECENVTCSGLGTCIDGINRHFCRCPKGKLPPGCIEDAIFTYDLCFDSPLGTASASLPFGIPMNNQFLSISLWVKFSSKTGTGTFCSMFEQADPDPLNVRTLLFSLAHDGLHTLVNTTEEHIFNFGSYVINNGEWHLVVITWDTTVGEFEVRANTVRVVHLTDYHRGRLLNQFYWISLGNEFSPASMTSVPGGGFKGCISQVNIFSRILDTNTDLPSMLLNTFSDGSRGDILQWAEFELWGLVRRVRPSTRLEPVCTSCSVLDRTILNLTCPRDIYLESTLPYNTVTWYLPQHGEGILLTTNLLSGTALSTGRHTVMYSASDTNNNTAVCSFRVYIRENNCEFPDLFGGVTKVCQADGTDNQFTGCSLSCPARHYTLSQTTPLYTCGPLGWWETGADRKCSPTFPTCGNITLKAKVNVKVRLVYPTTLTTCNLVKNSLETYIRGHIRILDKQWNNMLCVENQCQDAVLVVTCTSPAPVVEFAISNVGINLTSVDGDSKSPEDIFTHALLDQNRFHFENLIPNTNPVIDQSTIESVFVCPEAHLLVGSECVTCGFGMYLNTSTLSCEHCTKGYYYDSFYGNTSCKACPEGTTTRCPASVSSDQCHAVCQRGSFFNLTVGLCELCPLGLYQNESGQFQCLTCPYGQTTLQNGTTDIKLCFDMCATGFEISPQGSCSKCKVGTYRGDRNGPLCVPCPLGFTTLGNGSRTILNCSVVVCSPGLRADSTNTYCERCPIGQYQPNWNQVNCLPCPENTTTEMEAAEKEAMCERFCESGYERVGTECTACPVGQYKNNTNGLLSRCLTCPPGYVTPRVASTSDRNCTIYNCTEGSKINANNSGCELCPLGEYQPQKYQTDCLPCAKGSSTPHMGASQCDVFCPSGQKLKDGQCEPCSIGFYKNNTAGLFEDCKPCPVDFITANEGATTLDLCVVGNCTSGQYLVNTTLNCTNCPVGTYQPEKWQTECIPCPADTTTQGEGTTLRSECFLFCDAGYAGGNTTCDPCPMAYYKSMAGAIPCSVCPSGTRTQGTGATDESECRVAACEPGTYLLNNTCELCPYGQYQTDRWQDDCVPCPSATTTYRLGAALISDCIMECDGGYEYNHTSKQCEMCDRGYYRDESDPTHARCQPCPTETITAIGQVSTSILFCFMANCTVAGEYREPGENRCRPCPRGRYQDKKWQDMCEMCPDNYTTFIEGADSRNHCKLACDVGYQEKNNTCMPCPVGTYRQDGQWCQNCSIGRTTSSNAATDVDQCVPNCTRGQYYSEVSRTCELCARGTYQVEPYQKNCTQCGLGTTTRTGGATTSDHCLSLCHNHIHNCSEHAHCEVIGNSFTCTCQVGYLGDGHVCLHRCDTVEYCLNGGTCLLDVTQSIGCQCHYKYTGDRCQFRQDVDSIAPQTWTIIVGSVVGGVAFLTTFIIVSVLIGVTYRRYLANKAKNPRKSTENRHKSRPFATRATLGNYGSPTGPPCHLSVEETNNFKWSPIEGKMADVKYIDIDYDNNNDDAVYEPPGE